MRDEILSQIIREEKARRGDCKRGHRTKVQVAVNGRTMLKEEARADITFEDFQERHSEMAQNLLRLKLGMGHKWKTKGIRNIKDLLG